MMSVAESKAFEKEMASKKGRKRAQELKSADPILQEVKTKPEKRSKSVKTEKKPSLD